MVPKQEPPIGQARHVQFLLFDDESFKYCVLMSQSAAIVYDGFSHPGLKLKTKEKKYVKKEEQIH